MNPNAQAILPAFLDLTTHPNEATLARSLAPLLALAWAAFSRIRLLLRSIQLNMSVTILALAAPKSLLLALGLSLLVTLSHSATLAAKRWRSAAYVALVLDHERSLTGSLTQSMSTVTLGSRKNHLNTVTLTPSDALPSAVTVTLTPSASVLFLTAAVIVSVSTWTLSTSDALPLAVTLTLSAWVALTLLVAVILCLATATLGAASAVRIMAAVACRGSK